MIDDIERQIGLVKCIVMIERAIDKKKALVIRYGWHAETLTLRRLSHHHNPLRKKETKSEGLVDARREMTYDTL